MNVEAKKNELIQWILNLTEADLALLEVIKEKNLSNDIVAYTVDGKPLNLAQYQDELDEAEKEIERGDFLSSTQLDKEISTWMK